MLPLVFPRSEAFSTAINERSANQQIRLQEGDFPRLISVKMLNENEGKVFEVPLANGLIARVEQVDEELGTYLIGYVTIMGREATTLDFDGYEGSSLYYTDHTPELADLMQPYRAELRVIKVISQEESRKSANDEVSKRRDKLKVDVEHIRRTLEDEKLFLPGGFAKAEKELAEKRAELERLERLVDEARTAYHDAVDAVVSSRSSSPHNH